MIWADDKWNRAYGARFVEFYKVVRFPLYRIC